MKIILIVVCLILIFIKINSNNLIFVPENKKIYENFNNPPRNFLCEKDEIACILSYQKYNKNCKNSFSVWKEFQDTFHNKKIKNKKILNDSVSNKILPILRKVVTTKEGTASLANVNGYQVGGKTGTAQKSFMGGYSKNKKINTFVSVFPTSKPKFVLAVMLDEPQINSDYIYEYRDGSNFKLKGSPRNTAGWNSVEVSGHIIEKIGPILATKYSEIN